MHGLIVIGQIGYKFMIIIDQNGVLLATRGI